MRLDQNSMIIERNIISGSEFFAWYVPGTHCSKENYFKYNIAHSSQFGWFSSKPIGTCQIYKDFVAFRISQVGIMNKYGINEMRVSNVIVSDNAHSISLNGKGTNGKTSISESLIIGKSLLDCQFCYDEEINCNTNGIMTSLFEVVSTDNEFDLEFTYDALPLYKYENISFDVLGKQLIHTNVIKNFVDSECGTTATFLTTNDFIQDCSVNVELSNNQVVNTIKDNLFSFGETIRVIFTAYCQDVLCTGIYNLLILDDGSLTGEIDTPKSYFGNNRYLGPNSDCTFNSIWNGYECTERYLHLTMKQTEGKIISPVNLSFFENPEGKSYQNFVDNDKEFSAIVVHAGYHLIQYSQLPITNGTIYKLFGSNSNDYAVFRVQNTVANTLITVVDGLKIAPIVVRDHEDIEWSNYKWECGAHFYDVSNQSLTWIMNAKSICTVTVQILSTLNLGVILNYDVSDFYSNYGVATFIDKVAALLDIHPSRIRVVEINQEGSSQSQVNFYIEELEGETLDENQINQELQNLEIDDVSGVSCNPNLQNNPSSILGLLWRTIAILTTLII